MLFHLLFALLCCLLTWNCVSRIFRVAPEAGAAEDLHTSNPGRTFKTSQDQTPAPLAPLLTSTGGVCISMCAAPTAALLVELLVICYVFTRALFLSALVSSLKQFKVSKNWSVDLTSSLLRGNLFPPCLLCFINVFTIYLHMQSIIYLLVFLYKYLN